MRLWKKLNARASPGATSHLFSSPRWRSLVTGPRCAPTYHCLKTTHASLLTSRRDCPIRATDERGFHRFFIFPSVSSVFICGLLVSCRDHLLHKPLGHLACDCSTKRTQFSTGHEYL